MNLTRENYYSPEANAAYFSASQIKAFMDCPARTMAELRGEWSAPPSRALLIGSYVDAYFDGTLDDFRAAHPELFRRDGNLKAEYVHADRMIERAEQDRVFMEFMQGEKQVIRTGEIDGFPFKIRMDVLHPARIVDLKTVKDFHPVYRPGQGRMSFVEAWGYTLQGAIYQAIEGGGKPFYIDAVTKEEQPDLALIRIGQHYMDAEMEFLRDRLPYFDAIKRGAIEAHRCGRCAYCKATRVLTGPVELEEFEMDTMEEE